VTRGLKAIRQEAPEQDRNGPALASSQHYSESVQARFWPRNLKELRKHSREFGKAVLRDVEWSCVTVWLLNQSSDAELRNPPQVVRTVVLMVREYDRFRFNYPRHDGSEARFPTLEYLSSDTRQEALRVAAETLLDWRKAGRPHLDPKRIRAAYQHLISCPWFLQSDC
jgi:hypothetical protein